MSESTEQKLVVSWFRLQYPNYEQLMWSTPSGFFFGGKPTPRQLGQINKLKAEGWSSGILDLQFAIPNALYSGLFIEMKDKDKTYCSVTKDQRSRIHALTLAGYKAVWCAGYDEAKAIIKDYMKTAIKMPPVVPQSAS